MYAKRSPAEYDLCDKSIRKMIVLNTLARQVRRQKYLVGSVVIVAAMISLLCMGYRRYAFAVIQHCISGSHAEVGRHKVNLPILWWKESARAHDTSDMLDRNEWLGAGMPVELVPEA